MINPLYVNELADLEEVQEQRFEITDLSSLTWVLRKMSAIEAQRKEVNQVADNEIERIEAYRKKELESLQRSQDFFQSLVGEYAERKRQEDPKFKTQKTPYGSIGFKKQQPKWIYDDEKLLNHLHDNELYDFVRIKEEPNKAEIKKQFRVLDNGKVVDVDGQEVEGITIEPQPDKLEVKVDVE